MSKKQYSLMLVLALVAGLVGGVVSSQFFIGKSAFAEKKAKPQKVIEAQEFRLVDKEGKTRAMLGPTQTSYASAGEPRLVFLDKKDVPKMVLRVDHQGDPHLVLADRKDGRLELFGDRPRIEFYRSPNQDVAVFGFGPNREPYLAMYDPVRPFEVTDNSTLQFGREIQLSFRGEKVSLNLRDKDGRVRAVLGSTDLKHPQTGVVEKRPPSSLVLFGEQGRAIWQAP
jgi:hypothetical protein